MAAAAHLVGVIREIHFAPRLLRFLRGGFGVGGGGFCGNGLAWLDVDVGSGSR